MTKDEALKLALEALEYIHEGANNQGPHTGISWRCVSNKAEPAITAIKEALAQPEQERFLVATIGNWGRIEWADGVFPSLGDKMYSAPRTWVGLTDEDFQPMVQKAMAYYGYKPEHSTLTSGAGFYALVRNIEAKLKEKNT